MGTNYFLKPKRKALEKFRASVSQIHIGKSSAGWSFSFQALNSEELDGMDASITEDISSAQDWAKWISEDRYEICNEYGETISGAEFWQMVEDKKEGLNHYEETKRTYYNKSYVDDEGHSFTRGYFS